LTSQLFIAQLGYLVQIVQLLCGYRQLIKCIPLCQGPDVGAIDLTWNQKGRGGLIHQREMDDSVPILGSALAEDVHEAVLNDAIHDTISKGMTHATRRNYCSRLFRFIRHLEVHFPDYFGVLGVCQLTPRWAGVVLK